MFTELKPNVHLAQLAKAFAPGAAARREVYSDCIEPVLKQLQRQHASEGRTTIDVGVTSTCRGEGVSTIAFHLARLAAETGSGEVLLVRASPRSTDLEELPADHDRPGLREVLQGAAQLEDCIRRVGSPQLACLDFGAVDRCEGPLPVHRASHVLTSLRRLFGFIVVDLPSVTEPGPCLRIAAQLSGVILTVEAERLRRAEVENSCRLLRRSGATILGVVLNKHRGATGPCRPR